MHEPMEKKIEIEEKRKGRELTQAKSSLPKVLTQYLFQFRDGKKHKEKGKES